MRMTDRYGKSIRGISPIDDSPAKQCLNHQGNLLLRCMTRPDNRLLHEICGVFGNHQSTQRRCQQDDSSGLPKFECGNGIAIDEGLLHRCFNGLEFIQNSGDSFEELAQTQREFSFRIRPHSPVGDMP